MEKTKKNKGKMAKRGTINNCEKGGYGTRLFQLKRFAVSSLRGICYIMNIWEKTTIKF